MASSSRRMLFIIFAIASPAVVVHGIRLGPPYAGASKAALAAGEATVKPVFNPEDFTKMLNPLIKGVEVQACGSRILATAMLKDTTKSFVAARKDYFATRSAESGKVSLVATSTLVNKLVSPKDDQLPILAGAAVFVSKKRSIETMKKEYTSEFRDEVTAFGAIADRIPESGDENAEWDVELTFDVGIDLRGCWGRIRDLSGHEVCGEEALTQLVADIEDKIPKQANTSVNGDGLKTDTSGQSGSTIITSGFIVKNTKDIHEYNLLRDVMPKIGESIKARSETMMGKCYASALAPMCVVFRLPGATKDQEVQEVQWLAMRKIEIPNADKESVNLDDSQVEEVDLKGPEFSWKRTKSGKEAKKFGKTAKGYMEAIGGYANQLGNFFLRKAQRTPKEHPKVHIKDGDEVPGQGDPEANTTEDLEASRKDDPEASRKDDPEASRNDDPEDEEGEGDNQPEKEEDKKKEEDRMWKKKDIGFRKMFPEGLHLNTCGSRDAALTLELDAELLADQNMTDYSFYGKFYKSPGADTCICKDPDAPTFPLVFDVTVKKEGRFTGTMRMAVGIIDYIERYTVNFLDNYGIGSLMSTMKPPDQFKTMWMKMWPTYFHLPPREFQKAADTQGIIKEDSHAPRENLQVGQRVIALMSIKWDGGPTKLNKGFSRLFGKDAGKQNEYRKVELYKVYTNQLPEETPSEHHNMPLHTIYEVNSGDKGIIESIDDDGKLTVRWEKFYKTPKRHKVWPKQIMP